MYYLNNIGCQTASSYADETGRLRRKQQTQPYTIVVSCCSTVGHWVRCHENSGVQAYQNQENTNRKVEKFKFHT